MCVCACVPAVGVGISAYRTEVCREWCHERDFIVLGTDSQVYFCALLAGNTTKEIQVS